MRGGQTALNSEDLEEQRKTFLKKLLKNRPLCEMSLGNKMVLNRFLDHFLTTFLATFLATFWSLSDRVLTTFSATFLDTFFDTFLIKTQLSAARDGHPGQEGLPR